MSNVSLWRFVVVVLVLDIGTALSARELGVALFPSVYEAAVEEFVLY